MNRCVNGRVLMGKKNHPASSFFYFFRKAINPLNWGRVGKRLKLTRISRKPNLNHKWSWLETRGTRASLEEPVYRRSSTSLTEGHTRKLYFHKDKKLSRTSCITQQPASLLGLSIHYFGDCAGNSEFTWKVLGWDVGSHSNRGRTSPGIPKRWLPVSSGYTGSVLHGFESNTNLKETILLYTGAKWLTDFSFATKKWTDVRKHKRMYHHYGT